MTEIKYDRELPYVLLDSAERLLARFQYKADAMILQGLVGGQIVDTTPKPKIPEDAEFVYVELKDGPYYVRKREDGSWVDHTSSQFTSTDHLTRFLRGEGDAEVTVLVRKEDA